LKGTTSLAISILRGDGENNENENLCQARLQRILVFALMRRMAKKANPIEKAIDRVGGVRATAMACGVSTQAVYGWLQAGKLTTVKYALLLADAADMSVQELAGE
jgi:hypothetical protein